MHITPQGVISFVWILSVFVGSTLAAECDTLIVGTALNVPDNTECTMSTDIDAPDVVVTVYGSMRAVVASIGIACASLEIKAGGKVSADALSSSSTQPGAGNSLGSGGKFGRLKWEENLLKIFIQ